MDWNNDIMCDHEARVIHMTPSATAEFRRVMVGDGYSGTKIDAIKWIRQRCSLGLREAKEFVENVGLTMRNELGPGWIQIAAPFVSAYTLSAGMLMSHKTPAGRVLLFEAGTVAIDIETSTINVPNGLRLDEMQAVISLARTTFGPTVSANATINMFRPVT